jgi:hypothetical protein
MFVLVFSRCTDIELCSLQGNMSRAKLLKLRHEKLQQKKAREASGDADNSDGAEMDTSVYVAPNDMSPQLTNLVMPDMSAVRKYVVRPAPIPPPPKYVAMGDGKNHALDIDLWVRVFGFLSSGDLARCMCVCKTWNRWGYDRRLWRSIDLSRRRIRQTHLIGIVRRQPRALDLSWTNISHPQLRWLAERLPHLRELRLAGNSWPAVSALCGCRCPLLTHLNVAWVSGIYDACIRDLVSTPRDHRPGLDASASRFRRCSRLSLAGTDITDESLETIARHLPLLEHIDLSYCVGVGDDGIRVLSESSVCQTLASVALTGCVYVTNACFRHLDRFAKLRRVCVEACPEVEESACIAFANSRVDCVVLHKEHVRYVK